MTVIRRPGIPQRPGQPRPQQQARPAAPPQQGFPRSTTKGPIGAVPCPECGFKLDFRAHADAENGGAGWGEQGLEAGAMVQCDNPACRKNSKIMGIQKITAVQLGRVRQ